MKNRVVVTGLGVLCSIASNVETFWNRLLAGETGIGRLSAFEGKGYRVTTGAAVGDDVLGARLEALDLRPRDRALDMALCVAQDALIDADLDGGERSSAPIASIVGSAGNAAHSLLQTFTAYAEKGPRGVRPTSIPRCMANAVSAGISMRYGLTGANYSIASACTSSTNALGVGMRMIRDGYVSCVLCTGADASFDPFSYAAWDRLGVLSKHPDPAKACRPFDAERDGCILGEGAGTIVLESLDSARERGVRIRGEVVGYGESSDASHLTRPNSEGQATAIRAALDDAGIGAEDVALINAHGTATVANDESESAAIRLALGTDANRVQVVSHKSLFGHTLGASGVIESIAAILALENRRVPPNLNLDTPDPSCDLAFVGSEAVDLRGDIVLKNSFGFGGGNAVVVLRRWNDVRADA